MPATFNNNHDSDCSRFEKLYRGKSATVTCNTNNVGQEYICPKVSEGHIEEPQMSEWLKNQTTRNCHGPVGPLGNHCSSRSHRQLSGRPISSQAGGGHATRTAPCQEHNDGRPKTHMKHKGSHHIAQHHHPRNPNRHYEAGTAEVPGYYLNVAKDRIGGRAVQDRNDKNTPPSMLNVQRRNLAKRQFGCRQPYWNPQCS